MGECSAGIYGGRDPPRLFQILVPARADDQARGEVPPGHFPHVVHDRIRSPVHSLSLRR
jgi:hypothetical protein